jgi:hypothetical protein
MLSSGKKAAEKTECDLCREKKGRNATVVHILSHRDEESLRQHVVGVFESSYTQEFFLTLWKTAHRIYGNEARDKRAPLWLIYLEAHGVKVHRRGEAIMKHRGRIAFAESPDNQESV